MHAMAEQDKPDVDRHRRQLEVALPQRRDARVQTRGVPESRRARAMSYIDALCHDPSLNGDERIKITSYNTYLLSFALS